MCAGKGFFSSVRSDVALQEPRSGESFVAYFTYTRQGMASDVHLESSQAHVLLLTIFAAERFPGLGIAMQLSVLGKTCKSRIGLVALAAVEFFCFGGRRSWAGGIRGCLAILFFTGQGGQVQRLGVRAGWRRNTLLVFWLGGEEVGEQPRVPYKWRVVRSGAQDFWLRNYWQGVRLIQKWGDNHGLALQLAIIGLLVGRKMLLHQEGSRHLGWWSPRAGGPR